MRRGWAAFTVIVVIGAFIAIVQPVAASAGSVGKTGLGYWEAQGNGGVAALGDAGNLSGRATDAAGIVGVAAQPGGQGYVLAGADGGVFTFGDAKFYGSMGGTRLTRPIVGIAYSPSGHGYYLVASDGGVFTFGDARFHGSTGAIHLRSPIVGMAVTPSGKGYWLVAGDGGIFTFGDATFRGSAAALPLSAPIVGMAATHDGHGYWLAGSDGAIYSFGDAAFRGSARNDISTPVVGIAASPSGNGYLVASKFGDVAAFGDAPSCSPFFGEPIPDVPFPGGIDGIGGTTEFLFGGVDTGNTVGIAIPFDAATLGTFLAGSCGDVSKAFHATTPWHIDFTGPSTADFGFPGCDLTLLRANLGSPGLLPVLSELQSEAGSGRMEVRAAQMAGNTSFRIIAQGGCVGIARPGTGGTQTLPFTIKTGGDSLPFGSAAPITITGSSLQPCQVEVFANSDGHFVNGHYGSHSRFVVPAGKYFLRSDPGCNIKVT